MKTRRSKFSGVTQHVATALRHHVQGLTSRQIADYVDRQIKPQKKNTIESLGRNVSILLKRALDVGLVRKQGAYYVDVLAKQARRRRWQRGCCGRRRGRRRRRSGRRTRRSRSRSS